MKSILVTLLSTSLKFYKIFIMIKLLLIYTRYETNLFLIVIRNNKSLKKLICSYYIYFITKGIVLSKGKNTLISPNSFLI